MPEKNKLDIPNNKQVRWGCLKIVKAVNTGLYGSITFQFQDGVIIRTLTETSEKPPE